MEAIVDGEKHYVDVYIIRIPFVFEEDAARTITMLSNILKQIFLEKPAVNEV